LAYPEETPFDLNLKPSVALVILIAIIVFDGRVVRVERQRMCTFWWGKLLENDRMEG
jgi:hypothetical protein